MPSFNGNEFKDEKEYYVIQLGRPKTKDERKLTLWEPEGLLNEETYKKLPILLKLVK